MPRISALVILAAALAMGGCSSMHRSSAAGGSSSKMATHDVQIQMDSDGSMRTYQTDYALRNGDRVQVLPDGKVGPL